MAAKKRFFNVAAGLRRTFMAGMTVAIVTTAHALVAGPPEMKVVFTATVIASLLEFFRAD